MADRYVRREKVFTNVYFCTFNASTLKNSYTKIQTPIFFYLFRASSAHEEYMSLKSLTLFPLPSLSRTTAQTKSHFSPLPSVVVSCVVLSRPIKLVEQEPWPQRANSVRRTLLFLLNPRYMAPVTFRLLAQTENFAFELCTRAPSTGFYRIFFFAPSRLLPKVCQPEN